MQRDGQAFAVRKKCKSDAAPGVARQDIDGRDGDQAGRAEAVISTLLDNKRSVPGQSRQTGGNRDAVRRKQKPRDCRETAVPARRKKSGERAIDRREVMNRQDRGGWDSVSVFWSDLLTIEPAGVRAPRAEGVKIESRLAQEAAQPWGERECVVAPPCADRGLRVPERFGLW